MSKPTLIMMNMTYSHLWRQGMVNRNFHVLRQMQLSRMFERIICVDVLPTSLSKIARVALSSRPWMKNTHTIARTASYRIDADPVHNNTLYVSAYGVRSFIASIRALKVSIRSSIIWSYDPLSAERICSLKPRAYIFDAVDNWMEHPAYTHAVKRLQDAYAYITGHADLIFTVSEGLLDIFGRNSATFFVPNGVDYEHFRGVEKTVDTFIAPHERPIIGYHGVIQSRINFTILDYVISKHPEFQFQFLGPIWKEVKPEMQQLQKRSNVELKGSVPYLRLPESIHAFDCAIIPHKIDAFTHSMNPLKLYEYLAAGLPIVSTPVAGADQFQDLIRFAVSPEDFSREIQKAIATDSVELRKRRRAMAEQHTWKARFHIMTKIMQDRGIISSLHTN